MTEQNGTPSGHEAPQPTPPVSPYEQNQGYTQQVPPAQQYGGSYQQQQVPPPYGYQQMPPQGNPHQQNNPYQQGGPYQQPPYQQPYQQNNPYQQQGYPYWQQNQYPPAQKQNKVWPWVLIACLVLALVGMGGCVGCIACTAVLSESERSYSDDYYYDDYYYDDYYGFEEDDDYYDGYGYEYDAYDELYTSTYTLADIQSLITTEKSEIIEGKCTTGLYVVGEDIDPGIYFLEGNQTTEGSFIIFDQESKDAYTVSASVVYYGNYFAELEKGDVIFFSTPSDSLMYPAADTSIEVTDPIQSGLYRVGIDIPAGTYTVSYQTGAPTEASQESGVYIMKDLEWDEDSILEDHYLIEGGSHTITVTDGQYVELFLATMVSA